MKSQMNSDGTADLIYINSGTSTATLTINNANTLQAGGVTINAFSSDLEANNNYQVQPNEWSFLPQSVTLDRAL